MRALILVVVAIVVVAFVFHDYWDHYSGEKARIKAHLLRVLRPQTAGTVDAQVPAPA